MVVSLNAVLMLGGGWPLGRKAKIARIACEFGLGYLSLFPFSFFFEFSPPVPHRNPTA